ncbi:hypothetical protein TH25_02270 [Thalassospira profundimaris]|uniref:Uncharacterized protein n=1 Tax=Thalassospira profundimaris TaxID=502049 RepID=A0A367XMX6_9PROT|nr:hypothetical protein TH25_02270 [Thalassospira profundimaris]
MADLPHSRKKERKTSHGSLSGDLTRTFILNFLTGIHLKSGNPDTKITQDICAENRFAPAECQKKNQTFELF